MSDVNKVKSGAGMFYGFQDDVAREQISNTATDVSNLRTQISNMNSKKVESAIITSGQELLTLASSLYTNKPVPVLVVMQTTAANDILGLSNKTTHGVLLIRGLTSFRYLFTEGTKEYVAEISYLTNHWKSFVYAAGSIIEFDASNNMMIIDTDTYGYEQNPFGGGTGEPPLPSNW